MKTLFVGLIFICCFIDLQAATYAKTFTVGPGHNGEHYIKTNAKVGDVLEVTVVPVECYEMKSCEVDDGAKLGWQSKGNCTWSLTVTDEMETAKDLKARFYGTLKRICGEGESGGAPEDIPWDLTGKFTVFGECEGADHDNGRSPPAGLVTGGKTGDFARNGEAQIVQEGLSYWATGTFGGYPGHYVYLLTVDETAKKPVQLGEVEEKGCPDNENVKVKFVYFGCDDSAGIGAKLETDLIEINRYAPAQAIDDLVDALAQAKAALEAAKLAEAQAKTAAEAAAAKAEKAQQDYEQQLGEQSEVKAAQDRLAKAQARLDKAQDKLDDANNELQGRQGRLDEHVANKDNIVKQFGEDFYNSTLISLQDLVDKSVKKVAQRQGSVDAERPGVERAQRALKSAIEKVKELVEPARQAAEVAKTEAQEKQQAYADAQAATVAAQDAVDAAQKKLDDAKADISDEHADLLAKWEALYPGILEHEEGHRTIAYFYADKITEWMNTFRAWGWAVEEERARQLGAEHFEAVLTAYINNTLQEHEQFQKHYDSKQGTNHGFDQKDWDWSQLK